MATPKRDFATTVHQLHSSLDYAEPPIWRRLLLPSTNTLADLHRAIQAAMLWYDGHLHQFLIRGTYYSTSVMLDEPGIVDERTVQLAAVAPRKGHVLKYEYDFGDSWKMTLRVEAIVPAEPGAQYPVCVAGERAAPPDDCGGVWGYARLLDVLDDPDHPEHGGLLEWVGGPFDPNEVPLAEINRRLAPRRAQR